MKDTTHIKRHEVECKCGCGMVPLQGTVQRLQNLRDMLGAPVVITSGARCLAHNWAVGGSRKSQHLKGRAADIYMDWQMTEAHREALMFMAGVAGFTTLGQYDGFIHLDWRPRKQKRLIWWDDTQRSLDFKGERIT